MKEDIISVIKRGNTYIPIQKRILHEIKVAKEITTIDLLAVMNEGRDLLLSALSYALTLLERAWKVRCNDGLWRVR